jgi:hypothetical protein
MPAEAEKHVKPTEEEWAGRLWRSGNAGQVCRTVWKLMHVGPTMVHMMLMSPLSLPCPSTLYPFQEHYRVWQPAMAEQKLHTYILAKTSPVFKKFSLDVMQFKREHLHVHVRGARALIIMNLHDEGFIMKLVFGNLQEGALI